MIVFVLRMVMFVIWTIVILRQLRQLKREQQAAATHWADPWKLPRNRRALMLYGLWLALVGYAVGAITYLDIGFLDVVRVFNLGVSVSLLVIGLLLLWRD